LLFGVQFGEVRRPLFAGAVGVVVDVEGERRGRRGLGLDAEEGFEPGPGCVFDVRWRKGDGASRAVVPGRGAEDGAVPD
jgi:hypothetical protein